MLRIIESKSPGQAKRYYTTSDYFLKDQEMAGVWRGHGAARLGLVGRSPGDEIHQRDWDALCENRDPETGQRLTARRKEQRRVGYDFNFHVPKSVSLLYALSKDERILEAFRDSVRETMEDIEAEMKTRVRSGGADADRVTGNAVWGEYIHFTARPVGGMPDPHLHAHCFVHNVTWDKKESRWKAAQFGDLKRDSPYFEALYLSRLARRLEELGLPVERSKKGWEIAGVPTSALGKPNKSGV